MFYFGFSLSNISFSRGIHTSYKSIRFSRLVASGTRARSLSPSTELRDGNKRAAVICDFFAKGWCIRGSSCRFLHTTNKADNTSQQSGLDEVATREDQFDEGI